ncbi:hypothetical protein RRG08_042751 [Elysia crispata]|uniref:3-oxo-5alpha-steroid 4-dehydrogenase (NADP(+)) n=1 Tax=Elysia crispata TaxID=231223 RepID=A0AAE0XQE6_9GAST|nr:hypothetical protein RRG08_042751 [Elysia crispata]
MEYFSYFLVVWGLSVLWSLQTQTAPYGRYSRGGWGAFVPGKFAWVVQELPSFVVPILVFFYADCPKAGLPLNQLAIILFLIHYFQRTFVFPLLIRGGKPTPLFPFVLAFIFCCLNGYLQSGYILKYTDFSTASNARIVAGLATFLMGMLINIHSDHVLRNLRKPGETAYKIPHGGMFEFVSGANFFGEIVEWTGFAILNWSLPTLAFALFTMTNIGPRAVHHHRWYQEKFDDYPKKRKALIPFIL